MSRSDGLTSSLPEETAITMLDYRERAGREDVYFDGSYQPATSDSSSLFASFGYSEAEKKWRAKASCIGAEDIFFGAYEESQDTQIEREQRAARICGQCAVQSQCLSAALQRNEQHGFWGGLNERERKKLRNF